MVGFLASANQRAAHDAMFGLFCLLGVTGLMLAICGSVLGYKRKIVVYDSTADLTVTCASSISWVCSGIAFGYRSQAPFVVWLLLLVSIILTTNSIKRSVTANQTAWKGILSVFAKYTFVVLITFCAFIAVGGALATVDEVKKKRYQQAAANAAVAAVGALGFVSLRKLISELITENPSIKPDNQRPVG